MLELVVDGLLFALLSLLVLARTLAALAERLLAVRG